MNTVYNPYYVNFKKSIHLYAELGIKICMKRYTRN